MSGFGWWARSEFSDYYELGPFATREEVINAARSEFVCEPFSIVRAQLSSNEKYQLYDVIPFVKSDSFEEIEALSALRIIENEEEREVI